MIRSEQQQPDTEDYKLYGSTLYEVQEKVKLTCADRSQTVVRGVPMQVSHCMGRGTRRTFYILIWVVGTVQKVTNLYTLKICMFYCT